EIEDLFLLSSDVEGPAEEGQFDSQADLPLPAEDAIVNEAVQPAGDEARLDRLGQKAVRSTLHPADDFGRFLARCQQNEGNLPQLRVSLQGFAKLVAGHAGHVDVGNDAVESILLCAFQYIQSLLTAVGDDHTEAFVGQHHAKGFCLSGTVFDEKNSLHFLRPPAVPKRSSGRALRQSPPKTLSG